MKIVKIGLGLGLCMFAHASLFGAGIDIATLIEQTKQLASKVESTTDLPSAIERLIKEVPDKMLAYIPLTIETGRITDELKTGARDIFGLGLSTEELDMIKTGNIPSRVRNTIQNKISLLVQNIEAVQLNLKNMPTTISLLNSTVIPAAEPYLSDPLKGAVRNAVQFVAANINAVQPIANEISVFCDMLKRELNGLKGLPDNDFKNKLMSVVMSVKTQAMPLFNNTIKPFVTKNQDALFKAITQFKGVRFTQDDVNKINTALAQIRVG